MSRLERVRAMLAEIARALEARDKIRGHGARVTALAEAIAVKLGWSEEELETLRLAGPIHDVGKVSVPARILTKRAALTRNERREVERHPATGATLVQAIPAVRDALPIVLCHHERWDGGGYPAGLRAAAIPIEARVLAVADAFDAMTSGRPYRRAFSVERALSEIHRCAGTQFDPEVAEAFLAVWHRGILGELPSAAAF